MLYLESDPILWIPSDTFFRLQRRRLEAHRDLHKRLMRSDGAERDVLARVNLHLIRQLMVSPVVKDSQLRDALAELRYTETMDRFGMMFLHERGGLDLGEGRISHTRLPSKTVPILAYTEPHSDVRQAYPWGPALKISTVRELLRNNSSDFMKETMGSPEGVGLNAIRLFTLFSNQIWASLSEAHRRAPPDEVASLNGAISIWSLSSISQHLSAFSLHPNFSGLLQKPRRKKDIDMESFSSKRSFFFPADAGKSAIWSSFPYAAQYSDYVNFSTPEQVEKLHADLEVIFGLLQCLPFVSQRSPDKIWTVEPSQGGRQHPTPAVKMVANPRFYKLIEVVDDSSVVRSQRQRAQASAAAVQKALG